MSGSNLLVVQRAFYEIKGLGRIESHAQRPLINERRSYIIENGSALPKSKMTYGCSLWRLHQHHKSARHLTVSEFVKLNIKADNGSVRATTILGDLCDSRSEREFVDLFIEHKNGGYRLFIHDIEVPVLTIDDKLFPAGKDISLKDINKVRPSLIERVYGMPLSGLPSYFHSEIFRFPDEDHSPMARQEHRHRIEDKFCYSGFRIVDYTPGFVPVKLGCSRGIIPRARQPLNS